ncbi:Gfo/Idh/MocA family protein [Roseisolibacter agri]|uniref:Oxidoreductase n=1 Tax=Roseisolibacter agri TaxID=2014610 RepID=A0AA37QBW9_9BACT|nr:Gfo/Idh/MocA family oxidoreductase [Roseisolibacter agri]GLC23853.1 oxidoreductase [Roseisolibacter agri]
MSDQTLAPDLPRRDFLKQAAAGAAGLALAAAPGAAHATHATATTAASYARIRGANERVRVGIVGWSDRCRSTLLPAFQAAAKELNFEVVALSDIWSRRREEGVAQVGQAVGRAIRGFRNNEALYDAKVTDAVIISTADFQHALHGVEAMQAGQDAYIEKPLANTMADAKAIRDAVRSSRRIVQIGTQRRSSPKYRAANDYLRAGKFGDVVMAEMTWNVNQPGRWRRPELVAQIREQDTDWTRYLLNRPFEPWDPRKYVEYRLFWPYSSGIPDQWMVHQIDTVHWFTGFPRPRSVVANGGIYLWKDGRRNWDTATIVFDYGPLDDPTKGFQVVYASRMTNAAGDVKEYYYSNGGMLNLDTGRVTPEGGLTASFAKAMGREAFLLPETTLVESGARVETAASTGADRDSLLHVRDWMEAVRARRKPNADIEAGYNHSVALVMTIAAIQSGRKATFDDRAQQVALA